MLGLPLISTHPDRYHGKYVASMFASGEQGVWYDPSDFSTMFQDAAGTIPVTGVGQPVGLMLDKSKNGVGTNGTKRVNLLSYTEQFDKSAWVKTNATITANTSATTDPIGGNTADKLTETNAVSVHYVRVSGFPVVNGTSYVFSRFAKAAERSIIFLDCFDTVKSFGVSFNLLTGTVSGTRTGAGVVTPTITSVGNGWYRCQIVFTATATGTSSYWAQVGTLLVAGNFGDSDVNYAGDGTSGVFIWGADLRLSSEASTLPVYQRIDADWPSTIHGNHATQTTTASRPLLQQENGKHYLSFDGVDDFLVTPSIDFTGTDKMTVFSADVSQWDDATRGIFGLSSGAFQFNGTFWLTSFDGAYSAKSVAYLRGGLNGLRGAAFYTPDQRTLGLRRLIRSVRFDISKTTLAEEVSVRLNGVSQVVNPALDPSAGDGNFGNWPLYIGRIGSGCPFNGRLYQLVVRGAQTDNAHLINTERYLAYKTGVTL